MQTAHLRTSALHVNQQDLDAIYQKRKELKRERKNKEAAAVALAAAKLEAADFAAKVAAAVAQAAHKEMTSRNECHGARSTHMRQPTRKPPHRSRLQ